MQQQAYWTPIRFRCVSEEKVGEIQHRILDLKEAAKEVAAEFKLSLATIYRVKNAVPSDLVTVDAVALRRLRRPRRKQRQRRAS